VILVYTLLHVFEIVGQHDGIGSRASMFSDAGTNPSVSLFGGVFLKKVFLEQYENKPETVLHMPEIDQRDDVDC